MSRQRGKGTKEIQRVWEGDRKRGKRSEEEIKPEREEWMSNRVADNTNFYLLFCSIRRAYIAKHELSALLTGKHEENKCFTNFVHISHPTLDSNKEIGQKLTTNNCWELEVDTNRGTSSTLYDKGI